MFRDSGIKMIAIEIGKIIVSIMGNYKNHALHFYCKLKCFWESNGGKM